MTTVTDAESGQARSTRELRWVIADARAGDGRSGLFRYLSQKPDGWQQIPLSEEVSLTWEYGGQLPEKATLARMEEMEDALDELADSRDTVLALVMTVGGVREWCYYTDDYGGFMQKLNARLAGKPRYPISIVHSHDPEWSYWDSFVGRIEAKRSEAEPSAAGGLGTAGAATAH